MYGITVFEQMSKNHRQLYKDKKRRREDMDKSYCFIFKHAGNIIT